MARIARAYNVIIFLVAHPRKRKGDVTDFDADDVMGSGNITNAVDVVLQYDEAPDRFGKPDRLLAVKKNRLTGDVSDGIDLWFDQESKRITETLYPLKVKRYGWEDEDTWSDADNLDTIPF
jgi:twinkle protein